MATIEPTPASSTKEIPAEVVTDRFLWIIDENESSRLSALMGIDFAALGINGTYVSRPKITCKSCGKLSGLDDFVAESVERGIHSRDFVIKVLMGEEGDVQNSPPHRLRCLNCKVYYVEPRDVNMKPKEPKKRGNLLNWDEDTGAISLFGWAIHSFGWLVRSSGADKDTEKHAMLRWYHEQGNDGPSDRIGPYWMSLNSDQDKEKDTEKHVTLNWYHGRGDDGPGDRIGPYWMSLDSDKDKEKPAVMGWATGSGFSWTFGGSSKEEEKP